MSLLKKLSCLIFSKKDPLKFLKDILTDVEKETKHEVKDRLYTWIYQYDNWIDIVIPIIKNISREEQFNSMVIFRLMELQKVLLWLQICASYGAYYQLIRELRYLFESMLKAYYIDKNYPEKTTIEKLEILKGLEEKFYGIKIIKQLDLSNEDKEFLEKNLWKTLYIYSWNILAIKRNNR
jgi:hypothetical protein